MVLLRLAPLDDHGRTRDVQFRLRPVRQRQADPDEHPRQEQPLRVFQRRPHPQRAGLLVQARVDEIDLAGAREVGLVAEADADRDPVAVRPAEAQDGPLIDVECDADAVLGQDGEGRLVGAHQVAGIDQPPADPAVDRGGDPREAEVELRQLDRRLARLDLGLRLGVGGDAAVELLARHAGVEGLEPFQVGVGPGQAGDARRQLGFGPGEFGPVRPGVDLEQQVALLDLGPVLDVDLLQVASDAGADLDRRGRLGPAGDDDRVRPGADGRQQVGHHRRLVGGDDHRPEQRDEHHQPSVHGDSSEERAFFI